MITSSLSQNTLLGSLRAARTSVVFVRNLAAAQKSNSAIILDKIREYEQKSVGGKLVEPRPSIEKKLKIELEKLKRQHGGGSDVDMTSCPSFKFEEPKLDPIDEQAAMK